MFTITDGHHDTLTWAGAALADDNTDRALRDDLAAILAGVRALRSGDVEFRDAFTALLAEQPPVGEFAPHADALRFAAADRWMGVAR